jgi:hypothetical protein
MIVTAATQLSTMKRLTLDEAHLHLQGPQFQLSIPLAALENWSGYNMLERGLKQAGIELSAADWDLLASLPATPAGRNGLAELRSASINTGHVPRSRPRHPLPPEA